MKTNIFHSQRQASCDVLFYPITSVFLYSSDVTRPGGFRKNIYKERNRGKKENPYDVMQPLLKLNMRFQTTRCDSADVKNNNRAIGLKHSWTTLLWAFCSLNKLHWWVHLCKKKKSMSSLHSWHTCNPVKTRGNGVQKQKQACAPTFWGCSWDHTPLPLSKGHKVLERKAHLEEPMTQGCRISGNT